MTITLIGTEGESEPHHLTDPEKPVFERGGADMFLLTTQFSLGDLQSIRLWHDNSGEHTAWYRLPFKLSMRLIIISTVDNWQCCVQVCQQSDGAGHGEWSEMALPV